MTLTWLDTFRDRLSILVAMLILIIPIGVYGGLIYFHTLQSNALRTQQVTSNTLSEFEIVLDHLNGALINLHTSYEYCNADTRNLMHKLSFDIPAVEAFAVVNHYGFIRCSNWLRNTPSLNLELPLQTTGLHLTGEEYLSPIQNSGVLVYRPRSDGGNVVAIISSAYLRQILNLNLPLGDTLVLYNREAGKYIALNGLISESTLNLIQSQVHIEVGSNSRFNRLTVVESSQYPNIVAAYFSSNESFFNVVLEHRNEALLFLIMSLAATWGWLFYRKQKVNSIEFQIRIGLKHQEFVPYVQPVVDMNTGKRIGAEVLARWYRHGQVVAYPNEFITAAENANLISEITRQISRTLADGVHEWLTENPEFYFSINLSPNFIDAKTLASVDWFQQRYPTMNHTNVRFEITEHGLSSTRKTEFTEVITQLRDRGYLLGLDDFGTGQSGLEYFSNITPDFLKIDRRFVNAIDKPDSVDFQLLKTIVQLAQSLKLTIIAEGVETEREQQWLLEHNIVYAQGWLYQKAMPLDAFLASPVGSDSVEQTPVEALASV